MKYKRLTKKCSLGIGLTRTSGNITEDYIAVVNRLAELEDKIDNGQLVELPCKVGDVVYGVSKVLRQVIYGKLRWVDISYTVEENLSKKYLAPQYQLDYIYKTKEAAEAKLRELMGE